MSLSTTVKTINVNPAFLQEIKDSNLGLWKTVEQLSAACLPADDRGGTLNRLVPLLGELRDALALEFALEETYGYMEVPSAVAPVNNHLLHDIKSQHCTLYLRINELAERAEELQYRGWVSEKVDELLAEVLEFELRFRDHERVEADLIKCCRPTTLRQ
jgi:hypothetical protein